MMTAPPSLVVPLRATWRVTAPPVCVCMCECVSVLWKKFLLKRSDTRCFLSFSHRYSKYHTHTHTYKHTLTEPPQDNLLCRNATANFTLDDILDALLGFLKARSIFRRAFVCFGVCVCVEIGGRVSENFSYMYIQNIYLYIYVCVILLIVPNPLMSNHPGMGKPPLREMGLVGAVGKIMRVVGNRLGSKAPVCMCVCVCVCEEQERCRRIGLYLLILDKHTHVQSFFQSSPGSIRSRKRKGGGLYRSPPGDMYTHI
jgi:hypothetical protein